MSYNFAFVYRRVLIPHQTGFIRKGYSGVKTRVKSRCGACFTVVTIWWHRDKLEALLLVTFANNNTELKVISFSSATVSLWSKNRIVKKCHVLMIHLPQVWKLARILPLSPPWLHQMKSFESRNWTFGCCLKIYINYLRKITWTHPVRKFEWLI